MNSAVTWRHAKRWHSWLEDGLGVEVCCHSERVPDNSWDFPRQWNTYLLFGDKLRFSRGDQLCTPYVEPDKFTEHVWNNRACLDSLEGWNGGQTFAEFLVDDTGARRIKIGDDFQHSWDHYNSRFEMYDLEYMQRRILATAREAAELLRLLTKEPNP